MIVTIGFALILSGTIFVGCRIYRHRADFERRYAAISKAIPLHSRRVDVERYLTTNHIHFTRGLGPGSVAYDDIVPFCGVVDSSIDCGDVEAMARIRFAETAAGRTRRIGPAENAPTNPVYPQSDAADDEVIGFSYEAFSSSDI